MDAATRYAAMVDRAWAQRTAFGRGEAPAERWDRHAASYRFEPRRPLEPHVAAVAAFVRPTDTVVDVGGGAGRIGLPLALRCAEVANVEPSRAMGEHFLALAAESGIDNVSLVHSDWLAADVSGDVVFSADVCYFVREIRAFVEKLGRSARRRTVIALWRIPPPNLNADLFALAHGVAQELFPGIDELLPVLVEAGLSPEVQELEESFSWPEAAPATREEALQFALAALDARDRPECVARLEPHIDALFERSGGIWRPAWRPESRAVIASWS